MFTKSENFKEEYCAQIVKVGELFPIENSDFLARTEVNGFEIVVGKNDVKEGDVMVYAKLETEINAEFLSVNNQFELSERQMNSNFEEVQNLLDAGKEEDAKKLVGYFNKYGRVRIVKLRNVPSRGCLFTIDSLVKWKPEVANYDFSQCFVPNADGIVEPFCFDTIGEDLFVKAWVPRINVYAPSVKKSGLVKRNKRLKKFDRLIEGQFSLHYNTNQLEDNSWRLTPDTSVTISTKIHGTSHIVGNVLVKKPKNGIACKIIIKKKECELKGLYKAEKRFYWQRKVNSNKIKKLKDYINSLYTVGYGKVTSSRTKIMNQYINPRANESGGFYGTNDMYVSYGDLLYPYLIKGMTVYSEIFGYVTGKPDKVIQGFKKGDKKVCFDYGCKPGENKITPYRITVHNNDGSVTEWEVMEVYGWTIQLLKDHPELANKVVPIDIIYHGTLGDLYPNLDRETHWNTNVVKAIREDKARFHFEEDEPLCKNKVPREGIVLRIDNDPKSEAFKLKAMKFLGKEKKAMDDGDVDIEMMEAYVDEQ